MLKPVWNNRSISLSSKIRLMRSLVTFIFLYTCESWTLTVELQSWRQAMEMRCCRKVLSISYKNHVTLEQLESSLPIEDLHLNEFWNDVFQAYKQFGRKIQVKSSDELAAEPIFCNDKIQVGNRSICYKNWIDNKCSVLRTFWKKMAHLWQLSSLRKNMKLTQITLHILAAYKWSKATFLRQD